MCEPSKSNDSKSTDICLAGGVEARTFGDSQTGREKEGSGMNKRYQAPLYGTTLTMNEIRQGLHHLNQWIQAHKRVMRRNPSVKLGAKKWEKLAKLATVESDPKVVSIVVDAIDFLCQKHWSVKRIICDNGFIDFRRARPEREVEISQNSVLSISCITLSCIALEDSVARALRKEINNTKQIIRDVSDAIDFGVNNPLEMVDASEDVAAQQEVQLQEAPAPGVPPQVVPAQVAPPAEHQPQPQLQHQPQPQPQPQHQHQHDQQQPQNANAPGDIPAEVTDRLYAFFPDPQDRAKLLNVLLRQREDAEVVDVPARNGRIGKWFHFACAVGVRTWSTFRKYATTDTIKQLAQVLGGITAVGVMHLARRLYELNPEATINGVQDGGGVVMKPFTAEETVGLQARVNITARQRIRLAQVLSQSCGQTVLASHAKCMAVHVEHPLHYQYGQYEYLEYSETCQQRVRSVPYRTVNSFDALIVCLKNLRDGPLYTHGESTFGRNFGSRVGQAIGVNLLADHGNTDMRFMQNVLCLDGTEIDMSVNVGAFNAKENAEVMRNTCCPAINEGLEKMARSSVLILEWTAPKKGFDFVCLDAAVWPTATPCTGAVPEGIHIMREPDGRVCAAWDGPHAGTVYFDKLHIPHTYTAKLLSIATFLTGDLQLIALVQGRGNYAACRCPLCHLHHRDAKGGQHWQDERRCGRQLSVEEMEELVNKNIAAHSIGAPVSKAVRLKVQEACEKLGLEFQYNLFPTISILHHIFPVLHTVMGLTLKLYKLIFLFSDQHIEQQEPALVEAINQLLSAELAVNAAEEAVEAAENEQKEALKAQLKERRAEKKKKKEALVAARADRRFLAVDAALTKLFQEFNICTTAYHSHSLVGEHCARFLEHWREIAPRIAAIFRSNLRRNNAAADVDGKIDSFLESMTKGIDALHLLRLFMYSSTVLSVQEKSNFRRSAYFLGRLFRHDEFLGGGCVPVKMHLLESHAPDLMDEYGCLAQFLEEGIEREHHDYNVLNAQYNRVTNWIAKEKTIVTRQAQKNTPAVREFCENVVRKSKRKFSAMTMEKKEGKVGEKDGKKKLRLQETMLTVNAGLENIQ